MHDLIRASATAVPPRCGGTASSLMMEGEARQPGHTGSGDSKKEFPLGGIGKVCCWRRATPRGFEDFVSRGPEGSWEAGQVSRVQPVPSGLDRSIPGVVK